MQDIDSFQLKRVGELFEISFPLAPTILWAIWFITLCVFLFVSWMLVHHWGYYGVKENRKIFAKTIYFIGGIGLLALLALFIAGYTFIQ